MKIKDKLKIAVGLPISYTQRLFYKKPNVLSDLQTIDYIASNNCSVARYGDGELDLMCNIGIKFQKANKKLKKRLIEIAANDNTDVLVCVPNLFMSKREMNRLLTPSAAKWWRKHMFAMCGKWYKFFRGKNVYGDTQISRFYVDVNDKDRTADYVNKLKALWDGRDIVFIEGKNSRLGVGNDLFANANSIRRILCPSSDAFDIYQDILDKALELTTSGDLIICALGPTATVLSYDLTVNGRRCLDLGHIDIEYEWYLRGATQKIAIAGKETLEVTDDIAPCDNEKIDGVIYEFEA